MMDLERTGPCPAPAACARRGSGRLRRAGRYLLDRLEEPGTLRSFVWVCMALLGLDQGETVLTYVCGVSAVMLGLVSALRPETGR
jgi:hypothetical protein